MPSTDPSYVIRILDKKDDRSAFSCGNDDLDRYFRQYAGQHQFRHFLGTTYVAATPAGTIIGFVSVSAGSLSPADVAVWKASYPDLPLPILRLTRLGISQTAKGQGIGNALVATVCRLAHLQAETSGCIGIVVDAKPSAVSYYERLGFFKLAVEQGELGDRPLPIPMFLPQQRIPTAP